MILSNKDPAKKFPPKTRIKCAKDIDLRGCFFVGVFFFGKCEVTLLVSFSEQDEHWHDDGSNSFEAAQSMVHHSGGILLSSTEE